MNRALSGYAVFDLDGTLADSLGDISRALGRVLCRHGRKPVSVEETRDLIGKGPRTLMERAWMLTGHPADEEEVRNLTREYLEEYRKNPKGGTRSFPGVDEGLRKLVQRGWKLGLCTNKDGRAARALVVELFSFQQEKRADPEKKVVFLSQVLPAAINLGYQQYSGLVLEKLNGKEIHSLADLAAALDEAKEGDLVFEFTDDPGKLVLDAAEVRAKQEEIGKAYGITELRKL